MNILERTRKRLATGKDFPAEIEIEVRLSETNVTIRKKKFRGGVAKYLLWITPEQLEAAQKSKQADGACTCPRSDTGSVLYYSQDCNIHALPNRP